METTLTQHEVSQMLVTSFQIGWALGVGTMLVLIILVTICVRTRDKKKEDLLRQIVETFPQRQQMLPLITSARKFLGEKR